MPSDFLNCSKKVEEVKHLGCQVLSSSLFSLWFLIQLLLPVNYILIYTAVILSGPEKVSISETKTKQQITDKSHGDTTQLHLMGRHLSHDHDVSSGPQTPTGLSKQRRQHKCVCMCVFVGTCVFWYLPLVHRPAEAVADFVWILSV